jgi:hypothetical protein
MGEGDLLLVRGEVQPGCLKLVTLAVASDCNDGICDGDCVMIVAITHTARPTRGTRRELGVYISMSG